MASVKSRGPNRSPCWTPAGPDNVTRCVEWRRLDVGLGDQWHGSGEVLNSLPQHSFSGNRVEGVGQVQLNHYVASVGVSRRSGTQRAPPPCIRAVHLHRAAWGPVD